LTGSDKFIRATEPEVPQKGLVSPPMGNSGDYFGATSNPVGDGYTSRGAYQGKKTHRNSPSKITEYFYELKESDQKREPAKVDT
jgi:hypothetical protein